MFADRTPTSRVLASAVFVAFSFVVSACRDDTNTAPGAVVNLTFESPDSAHSGESVLVDVRAVNIGINNVHDGRVEVTLPAPLHVDSTEASDGSATFSNGAGGASVTWMLGTLDSNSQSRLHIHVTGTLPSAAAMSLTMRASMTADGVRAGDVTAEKTLQLTP